MSLLRLSDNVLLELVAAEPALGLACGRLYGLYQAHFRRRVLARAEAAAKEAAGADETDEQICEAAEAAAAEVAAAEGAAVGAAAAAGAGGETPQLVVGAGAREAAREAVREAARERARAAAAGAAAACALLAEMHARAAPLLVSWATTELLARIDVCFFDARSISGARPAALAPAPAAAVLGGELSRAQCACPWLDVHGQPWGGALLATDVPWLRLRQSTRLPPGRHRVWLNARYTGGANLAPLWFVVRQTPHVRQASSPFARAPTPAEPRKAHKADAWSAPGGAAARYAASRLAAFAGHGAFGPPPETLASCEAVDLCVGVIDVAPMGAAEAAEAADAAAPAAAAAGAPAPARAVPTWPRVDFDIEDGPLSRRRMLFNYLYFERVPADTPAELEWQPRAPRLAPTLALRGLYDTYHARLQV